MILGNRFHFKVAHLYFPIHPVPDCPYNVLVKGLPIHFSIFASVMPDVNGKLNIYGKLANICCAAGPTFYILQTVETTFLILIDPNICEKKNTNIT